ncbi:MAG: TetR/AcrR family transcriptional regulator [Clostridia bacterium]|nr:TetR/AcrR family transcriptional regulator [Clostridia bacterium]MDY3785151.1 TetR/AcrR family transcriptional regulator [Eubacteriales bacterium]
MPRKQMFEGGTKNKILEVGGRLFFENGFDGTGVRAIMKEVGADVGVFYYYYKNKDELFDDVLDKFFMEYRAGFASVVEKASKKPFLALYEFFDYVQLITKEFREKYEGKMHRTVRWAIREQTLTEMEPYIEKIINILVEYGANPRMDAHLSAIFLSHGVGSVILHETSDWMESVTGELRKTINLLMGIEEDISYDNSEISGMLNL